MKLNMLNMYFYNHDKPFVSFYCVMSNCFVLQQGLFASAGAYNCA